MSRKAKLDFLQTFSYLPPLPLENTYQTRSNLCNTFKRSMRVLSDFIYRCRCTLTAHFFLLAASGSTSEGKISARKRSKEFVPLTLVRKTSCPQTSVSNRGLQLQRGHCMGPIRNRKTAQNFRENRKTAIKTANKNSKFTNLKPTAKGPQPQPN